MAVVSSLAAEPRPRDPHPGRCDHRRRNRTHDWWHQAQGRPGLERPDLRLSGLWSSAPDLERPVR
ncbi:hypothetical protein GCM10012289_45390 [Nonomuraea cavernae]|uniref:Uncharacterized protein n=1 Tax=Nonomuraea cavernae TaxID=2045107 RepID=A0A917Z458_9ACTN|nr:hypothetical protein GCM10012289_45390 [Nonomuraea cavernae]